MVGFRIGVRGLCPAKRSQCPDGFRMNLGECRTAMRLCEKNHSGCTAGYDTPLVRWLVTYHASGAFAIGALTRSPKCLMIFNSLRVAAEVSSEQQV